jgi:DNA-binding XRE family transcriptional regulator
MNRRIFISNLINLRRASKLYQKEMAVILDIKLCTYQAWEEGRSFPKPEVQIKIANHFQYNLQTLLTTLLPINMPV